MFKRILLRLAACMLAAVAFCLSVSWYVSDVYCTRSIRLQLADAFDSTARSLHYQPFGAEIYLTVVGGRTTSALRVIDDLTEGNYAYCNSQAKLAVLKSLLSLESLDLVDQYGVIHASSEPQRQGTWLLPYDVGLNLDSQRRDNLWRTWADRVLEIARTGRRDGSISYFCCRLGATPWRLRLGVSNNYLGSLARMVDPRDLTGGLNNNWVGVDIIREGRIVSGNVDYNPATPVRVAYGRELSEMPGPGRLFTCTRDGVPSLCALDTYGPFVFLGHIPVSRAFATRGYTFLSLALGQIVVFVVLFAGLALSVRDTVTAGIERVVASLGRITGGNLEERVNEHSSPEFSELSRGINQTVSSLRTLMDEHSAAAARQLELARVIQESCLPRSFPVYPERPEVDVFATACPAQEVGGDFYDFFRITENKYCLVVADVSDHGVPAALFMMRARTTVHNTVLSGRSLASAVGLINSTLCENNDAGMFVTAFIAIIDGNTGQLTYVNAGHNPPLLWRAVAGQPESLNHLNRRFLDQGHWEKLRSSHNFVLAGLDDITFHSEQLQLNPGDILYLYTDGVTDALNPVDAFYSMPRLQEVLTAAVQDNYDCLDLLCRVNDSLDAFMDGRPVVDDITMMLVHYLGDLGRKRVIDVPAREEELERVQAFVDALMVEAQANAKLRANMAVICEEVFINIASYAYEGEEGRVRVRADLNVLGGEVKVCLHFIDSGIPHDPMRVPTPDIRASFAERPIGGLGIFLVHRLSDEMTYRYSRGFNILRIVKTVRKL